MLTEIQENKGKLGWKIKTEQPYKQPMDQDL